MNKRVLYGNEANELYLTHFGDKENYSYDMDLFSRVAKVNEIGENVVKFEIIGMRAVVLIKFKGFAETGHKNIEVAFTYNGAVIFDKIQIGLSPLIEWKSPGALEEALNGICIDKNSGLDDDFFADYTDIQLEWLESDSKQELELVQHLIYNDIVLVR